jgi:hypothetical protein
MALNKRTAGYLAEEVRKAEAELEAARAFTCEAQAREEAAQIKLDALKAAMGPGAPEGASKPASQGQSSLFPAATDAQPGTTIGFRQAIRTVLNEAAPKGLRPKDAHRRLIEHGLVYKGKTDPGLRTANELYRMVKEGHARKRGRLYYALLPQDSSGETTQ